MGGERRGEVLGRVGFLHVILSFFPLASSVFVIFLSRLGYAIHETVSRSSYFKTSLEIFPAAPTSLPHSPPPPASTLRIAFSLLRKTTL
jgi:hypothetical protein